MAVHLTIYPRSRSTISRFVFKRSLKTAILWGLILGSYVASKSIGFAKLYPTHIQREEFASGLGSNSGLSMLLGRPHDLTTVAGYTAWNTVGIACIALAVWAILLTTKHLRGDEVNGRLETLLSGQTSLQKATASILSALTASLAILFLIAGLIFAMTGADKSISFSASAAFYLSLAISLSGLVFMAISALVSQLVSTRGRAVGVSASLFGLFFLIKAIGDSTNMSWLTNLSPLGWIENLRPLAGPSPVWLIPIVALVLVVLGLSLALAGRRDLGDSLFKDKAESNPRLGLLSSPFALSVRLNRFSSLGWAIGIAGFAFFYGLITKAAVQALADSTSTKKVFNSIVSGASANSSAAVFISVTFLIVMVMLFFLSAYLINHIRNEEAEGRIDNLIVGPISRTRWLVSKLSYSVAIIVLISLVSATATWVGSRNVHASSLSLHNLLLAGLNSVPATLLVLGIGVFILGFRPRLTAIIVYAVIGWSFLIDMLQSGTKINHYILDSSIFTHVHLAPAANINWGTNLILLAIAIFLSIIGIYRFSQRDIQAE